MTDIILFGIQGSGKGTQARMLKEKFPDFYYFEMGQVFRNFFKSGSEFAKKLQEKINQGYLATDEEVMQLFSEEIQRIKEQNSGKLPKRFIFDGIPRKPGQKIAMDKWLQENSREAIAVQILLDEQKAINRLTKRRVCSSCGKPFPADYPSNVCDVCGGKIVVREDENKNAILKRIQEFKDNTIPVIKEYEKEGRLIKINGDQSPQEVFNELLEKLKNYL